MTATELKTAYEAAKEAYVSLLSMVEAGIKIGNTYGFISKAEVLAASERKHAAWLDWTCA